MSESTKRAAEEKISWEGLQQLMDEDTVPVSYTHLFPQQDMHFTGINLQRNIVKGFDTRKFFGNAFHFD